MACTLRRGSTPWSTSAGRQRRSLTAESLRLCSSDTQAWTRGWWAPQVQLYLRRPIALRCLSWSHKIYKSLNCIQSIMGPYRALRSHNLPIPFASRIGSSLISLLLISKKKRKCFLRAASTSSPRLHSLILWATQREKWPRGGSGGLFKKSQQPVQLSRIIQTRVPQSKDITPRATGA